MGHLGFLNSIQPKLQLFVFLIQNIIKYGLYMQVQQLNFLYFISELLWFMRLMYTERLPIVWKLIYLIKFNYIMFFTFLIANFIRR